jgi:peptidoglycan hydrolase-like protein with peptidoglycan-binding domain
MSEVRWPNGSVTQPRVSSPFGPRPSPGGVGSTFHRGADMPEIYQVRSIADGVVRVVGTPSGWSPGGKQVWIQSDGFFTRYMHLGGYNVRNGQSVSVGQIIGSQDTTGTAVGSNLHFEITPGTLHYSNSGQVDPVAFIRARLAGSTAGSGGSSVYDQWGGSAYLKSGQQKAKNLGYEITVDGIDGPQSRGVFSDIQRKNGLTVDGIAGPATNAVMDRLLSAPVGFNSIPEFRSTADVQRKLGLSPVDGIYGPATTKAVTDFQRANPPLVPDGIYGPATDGVLFAVVPGGLPNLEVDGVLGEATWKATQASLGFTGDDVDGDPGPKTISALQRAVGMPENLVDGELGPVTARYIQASLGVRQDGVIGELTVKAWQSLLNRGGKFVPGDLVDDEEDGPSNPPDPETPTGALPRSAWTTEPLTGEALIPIAKEMRDGFAVHWDGNATPTTEDEALAMLRAYEAYHRTAAGGSAGGLKYNLAVSPVTGNVYVGRGLENRGMHAGGANVPNIGCILIGGPGNLTAAGQSGLQRAYRIACEYVGRPLAQRVHSDLNATSCPGDEIRAWVKGGGLMQGLPIPDPAPDPDPVPDPEPDDPELVTVSRAPLSDFRAWIDTVLG